MWVSDAGAPSEANGWEWNWDQAVTGEFTFVGTFIVAEWKRDYISELTLTIAADDYYTVTFTGNPIVEERGGSGDDTMEYGLKEMLIYSVEMGD